MIRGDCEMMVEKFGKFRVNSKTQIWLLCTGASMPDDLRISPTAAGKYGPLARRKKLKKLKVE